MSATQVCKHCQRPVTYSPYFGWLTKDDGISVCTKYNGKHEVEPSEPTSLNAPATTNERTSLVERAQNVYGRLLGQQSLGGAALVDDVLDVMEVLLAFMDGNFTLPPQGETGSGTVTAEVNPEGHTMVAPAGTEGQDGKMSSLQDDIPLWALNSATRRGEIAVMFLNPIHRQNEKGDEFAVIYAKRAASAALFFLGREPEEKYVGIPNVPAMVHSGERFSGKAKAWAEEVLPRIMELADSACGGSDEQLISELAEAFKDFAESEIAWRSAGK